MKTYSTSLPLNQNKETINAVQLKKRAAGNRKAISEYTNYALLLQIYTLNKNEAAGAKTVTYTGELKSNKAETFVKSELPVWMKIKYAFNHLFETVVSRGLNIVE